MMRLLAGRVDEAAVNRAVTVNYMVRFSGEGVTVFKAWRTEEVWLYAARGRRAVTAYFTGEPSVADLEGLLRRLESVPEDPLYVPLGGPSPPGESEAEEAYEGLADVAKALMDGVGAERCAGAVRLIRAEVSYEDTHGRSGRYALNRAFATVRAFTGELAATAAVAGRSLGALRAARAGEEAAAVLSLARGLPAERVQGGRARLLLSPLVFGHLVGEVASHWAVASAIIAGASRYGPGDLGREAASPLLTVRDITADPAAYGHVPFDAEGNPVRRVEIFRRGVLSGFLHTNRTAAKLGTETTGHALRGPMWPAPGHVAVEPGDGPGDLEGLLRELGSGYYIHNNWYTRYQNVKTGLFSTVGRDVALRVENGRPAAVVRYIRIADTLESVVKNVRLLSKAAPQIYWWDMSTPATAPYAVVEDVGITT